MRTAILLLVPMLHAAAAGHAHHSLTEYDTTRRAAMDVIVREFHFVNPHPYLVVEPAGAAEAQQVWRLELDNRRELVRIGMGPDTFARGDRLVVAGAPGRDQQRILYVRALDRPGDGLRYEQVESTPRMTSPPRRRDSQPD